MYDTTKSSEVNTTHDLDSYLISMAQMSYLPEAAYLGLHYPDKYMLTFDFNVWYHKKFKGQYNSWPRFLFG